MTALLFSSDPRCPQCKDDGKCSECNGTGVNARLNEDDPKCRNCRGTGKCPACEGRGRAFTPPSEVEHLGLDKL
jgi:hypothetical protein